MKRTAATAERNIIKLIALGERYAAITLQTGISIPTIKKIRKRNLAAIEQLKARALETQTEQISSIVARSNTMIKVQLNKSERDEEILSLLSEQYRDGEISRSEYYKRKHGLKPLSIKELLLICETMQQQVNTERNLAGTHGLRLTSHLSHL